MAPERTVHYADSGGLQIAYEVMGDGPLDIVLGFDTGGNIDLMHEHPAVDRFLRRFGEYGRLIHVDLRGAGLSDPIEHLPTLEDWADDVRAVLAAVGSERAAFVGHGRLPSCFMLFAAMHPEPDRGPGDHQRICPDASGRRLSRGVYRRGYEAAMLEFIADSWGTGRALGRDDSWALVRAREHGTGWRAWSGRRRPRGAPRSGSACALDLDVRDVLPTIHAPTLVIQSRDNAYIRRGHAQYLVDHIAGARYVELPTCRPCAVRGGHGPPHGRDPGVPDRDDASRGHRPRPQDGGLHRHRRLHPAGR